MVSDMAKTMERAVLVNNVDKLTQYGEPFDRLYFGHEFCQRLFPTADQIKQAHEAATSRGKAFTVVTPFVTNAGLALLRKRLQPLLSNGAADSIEIVVNDWGVLNWLHREHPTVPLALGRLLTKQKRGPQIMNMVDRLPAPAVAHFQCSNVDIPHVQRFLESKGVKRVELDNLLQGMVRNGGLAASLYYPYAYISTTRLCLLVDGDRPGKNFRSIAKCSHECMHYKVTLRHEDMPVPVVLKGNTQYFRNDKLPPNLEKLNITRLVHVPELA
jgi:hypothetical protein